MSALDVVDSNLQSRPAKPTRLGVMAAMPQELQAFLDAMPDEQRRTVAGRDFWVGHWAGQEVVAVLSRIGKVAAAITTSVLINEFKVDAVVFTGVAGGLGAGVNVGDVVVADSLVQHDMDASPLFPRFELPGTGITTIATDRLWSNRASDAAEAILREAARTHRGLIVSGDVFVSSEQASSAILGALPNALAVEMEGAAVAQVCYDFGVPFAIVRIISDRADDKAHIDFTKFVNEVASPTSLAIVNDLIANQAKRW